MAASAEPTVLVVFPSRLGWMAMIGAGDVLRQLTLAHPSPDAAARACSRELLENAQQGSWNEPLLRRLQAYACGVPTDFRDVRVDPGRLTEFRRRVAHQCRQIPYGKTLSYGQLAAEAGSPGAARAVGNCLAANRIPLIIPCHRVLRADGQPGAYSAPGGTRTKKRLLALEGLHFASGLIASPTPFRSRGTG
jgi:methylated-DNA-[protein]-cysteine S-methyltransferase